MAFNRGKFQLWIGDQLKAENLDSYINLLKEMLPENASSLVSQQQFISADWLTSIQTRKPPICDVETGINDRQRFAIHWSISPISMGN